jgi:tRNA uridine 5-carboxymethylaminomethyl modification enzyme
MFTSRSELRLQLRAENSDLRLTKKAFDQVEGLIGHSQYQTLLQKTALLEKANEFLMSYTLPNNVWYQRGIKRASPTKTEQVSAQKILSYPNVKLADVQKVWQSDVDFEVDLRVASTLQI